MTQIFSRLCGEVVRGHAHVLRNGVVEGPLTTQENCMARIAWYLGGNIEVDKHRYVVDIIDSYDDDDDDDDDDDYDLGVDVENNHNTPSYGSHLSQWYRIRSYQPIRHVVRGIPTCCSPEPLLHTNSHRWY